MSGDGRWRRRSKFASAGRRDSLVIARASWLPLREIWPECGLQEIWVPRLGRCMFTRSLVCAFLRTMTAEEACTLRTFPPMHD